jgi:L,D-transpeptidase YcbB
VRTVVNWILQGQGDYSEVQYDQITADKQPYELKVQDPPSVRFMYLTAWATPPEGGVNFRPDIYGLDGTGFVIGWFSTHASIVRPSSNPSVIFVWW